MLKLSNRAARQRQPFARSHVGFKGEAAVNGLEVMPDWLTGKEELEVLPSPSRRRWRAIFRHDYRVLRPLGCSKRLDAFVIDTRSERCHRRGTQYHMADARMIAKEH